MREILASVIPTYTARSFDFFFRLASMTSRLTTIGIYLPLDEFFVFFCELTSLLHDKGNNEYCNAQEDGGDIGTGK